MLSTSVYSWAVTAQLRRERVIGTGLTVPYAILSLIFVADIAVGVLLFGHSRRRPRLALTWFLLGTGVAIIVAGVLDFFFDFLSRVLPVADSHGNDLLEWGILVVVGIVVILTTGIGTVVRRSTLRAEAQQAVRAVVTPTEIDTSKRVLAG